MTATDIRSIRDFDLKEKVVFLRLDLNVPVKDGKITSDYRIRQSIPTIQYALEQGAKVIIGTHYGRPKGEINPHYSLELIASHLGKLAQIEVLLIEDLHGEAPRALLNNIKSDQVLLYENLRFDPEETSNGAELAQSLTSCIDVYINDAFGVCHRSHCSVVALPRLIKERGMGLLVEQETQALDSLLMNVKHPYVAVLGGAKVTDKVPVIENLIDKVDAFIVGGAMAYTFLKVQNIGVGGSLVEDSKISFVKALLERLKTRNKRIYLPLDHVVASSLDSNDVKVTKDLIVPRDKMAFDIGPQTIQKFSEVIDRAQTVFWNGPMGVFETPAFSKGTMAITEALAQCEGTTIVGGGDTASAVLASGFEDQMTHISTGGGASLEYLEGKQLPGLQALYPIKQSDVPSEGLLA